MDKEFTPVSFSTDTTLSCSLTFVGYGLNFSTKSEDGEKELIWNDYQNLDVSGKFVLILRGSPDPDQELFESYISLREKVLTARDKNAAGVIFVSGEQFDLDDELISILADDARIPSVLPVVHIKRSIADRLLEGQEWSITALEEKITTHQKPHSFEIPLETTIQTQILKKYVKTQNVLAYLQGKDSTLTDEYVILGAHYDHLGMGGFGTDSRQPDTIAVHNGADDNASGVSAILEILEKLKSNQNDLRRGVLFLAFGAEEMGLLGSNFYTKYPIKALDKAAFMFNLDMIGGFDRQDEAVTVGGTGTAIGLSDLVNQFAEDMEIDIKESDEGLGPSDHSSFYAKDVPVLFLFSGMMEYYHTPADDIDKIEFEGLKTIADFSYNLLFEIANKSAPMEFQEAGPKARPEGGRRRFKVTLGIMPDIAATDIKGLRVEAIMPDRPAALGGIEKGDVIIGMEGKTVNNIYDYMNRLQSFKKGQRILVDVLREGEKREIIVEL